MTLFSYVVARDYGFAPNPFGEFCTLATCKPNIRRFAQIGDWIVGTGSASNHRAGHLVYAMRVSETMTFDAYWEDRRFQYKKPSLEGSTKVSFGDNIYHRVGGDWAQADSHHSYAEGMRNIKNIRNDTQADRVLIGRNFAYWGGSGPLIPVALRNYEGHDLCIGRGYKRYFPAGMEAYFAEWFLSLGASGYLGRPIDWWGSV
jgi:hypothetical protein